LGFGIVLAMGFTELGRLMGVTGLVHGGTNVKRSLLERIRKNDDANLGAALVRMAHEAVAVHRYEAAVAPSDVADRWQGLSRGDATVGVSFAPSIEEAARLNDSDTAGDSK
jgi:hypothetical protein